MNPVQQRWQWNHVEVFDLPSRFWEVRDIELGDQEGLVGPQDNRKHLETLPPVTHATGHTQVTLRTSNTEVCWCGYTILCFGLHVHCRAAVFFHTSCFAVVYFSIHPPVVAVGKACWANRKIHVHAYKHIFRPLPRKTDMQEASFELPLQTWALFLPLSFLFFFLCSISSALPTWWERPVWNFSGLGAYK